jgi:hypothetical protein
MPEDLGSLLTARHLAIARVDVAGTVLAANLTAFPVTPVIGEEAARRLSADIGSIRKLAFCTGGPGVRVGHPPPCRGTIDSS